MVHGKVGVVVSSLEQTSVLLAEQDTAVREVTHGQKMRTLRAAPFLCVFPSYVPPPSDRLGSVWTSGLKR